MNFDDYAQHMYQKHRLCVAIAVLKSKPASLTSTEYIKVLQSKMADGIEDDDVTICSDDFMMDDDSVNILGDFDDELIEEGNVSNDGRQGTETEKRRTEDLPEQSTQVTYYNSFQSQTDPTIDNDVTFCEAGFYPANDILPKSNENHLNDKECNPNINGNLFFKDDSNNNNEVITNSNYDSQKTILYTVHGFTQNYTHYSPSQNEISIPSKYLYRLKEDNNETTLVSNSNSTANALNSHVTNVNSLTKTNGGNIDNDNRRQDQTKRGSQDIMSKSILANQNVDLFAQNTNEIDLTQNINNGHENNHFADKNSEYSENVYNYFSEIHSINDQNRIETENSKYTLESMQVVTNFLQIDGNIDDFESNNKYLETIQNADTVKNLKEAIPDENNTRRNCRQEFGLNLDSSEQNNKEKSFEEESDTIEAIPYKVLEELNKIKMYLRRRDRRLSCDGYSTDSGYRSDSQLRSSNRSALQLSGITINQSAYCLFNYITKCPLVGVTREITTEIAQTLGQLIDRLHEEETYPPFLEELLDTVDVLLRQVYEGQSYDDSEFLKKEEYIQRIMLLNKSIHIQSHCIEKITSIIIKFHEKITDNNVTYELTNIDEVENISYLFHILEMLLKKYIRDKDMLSQGSQSSQDEDKILNKTSITDIWRKKWNPKFKEKNVGSRENRCVLKSCSEILNKVIVDCVNSYSLVAYSALKCFNSLQ